MLGQAKVREAVDKVKTAASDTQRAIIGIGALALIALAAALVAIVLGARRPVVLR